MTTYTYRNVIPGYTKTYDGITITPAGVAYPVDNKTLNKYVPSHIERYVDGVISTANIVKDLPAPHTNQQIADEQALLIKAGAKYQLFDVDTAIGTVGVAATFTTLTPADSVASTGFLQLSSSGVHGLTTGATHAGKWLYVAWSAGTGVSGLYAIKSVDSTLIITLDTPSTGFAGMGTAVVTKVGSAVPLYTTTVYANTLGTNGELNIESLWSHTSSANNKTISVDFGGTNFGAYVTPSTVLSTKYSKNIQNRTTATQISSSLITLGDGSYNSAVVTGTVDTTADKSLVISGTLATANEVLQLELFSCRLEA